MIISKGESRKAWFSSLLYSLGFSRGPYLSGRFEGSSIERRGGVDQQAV
jgi:hypothetical protein